MEAGLRPVLVERGKPVEQRGRSIGALFNRGLLDPEVTVHLFDSYIDCLNGLFVRHCSYQTIASRVVYL